jgi:hypothetical protein
MTISRASSSACVNTEESILKKKRKNKCLMA